ncbi:MAG: hypothetical protein ACI4CZ_01230 [Hominisplanchenecus sp.]
MLYYELLPGIRMILGMCCMFVMTGALFLFVTVCIRHMGLGQLLFSLTLAAVALFMLFGMNSVSRKMETGCPFTFLSGTIGNLSWWIVTGILLLLGICECLWFVVFWRRKSRIQIPEAIKESLDTLPDAVCYFLENGQPLLVNKQMNRLCGVLLDSEILNVNHFLEKLWEKRVKKGNEIIRTEPTVIVRTVDGEVWDFHQTVLRAQPSGFIELAAYNVTEPYQLSQELKAKNESLSRINERLRAYSLEVDHITREQEILNAKIQVHNNIGRALLAFRAYLEQPSEKRDRKNLLLLWRNTMILQHEADAERRSSDWELLQKAAGAIDVKMILQGELTEEKRNRKILITAMHECLTNTRKHADGSELYVTVTECEGRIAAELKNDGKVPEREIEETGGLKNLRRMVEEAGGRMTIESRPRFLLHLDLPKEDVCL